MARKNINTVHIEGRLYQHDLEIKTVQNQQSKNYGKDYISGSVDIATDEDGLNVLTVHYTYVTETTSSGKHNNTYSILEKIIKEGKTWVTDGKDLAMRVKADTALGLNEFYSQDNNLVSVKRNEGGFIDIVNNLCQENDRNTFSADMVITNVRRVEADEERNISEDYVILKGAIFNFKNDLLPIEFTVKNENGMAYFESLGANTSEPVYTKVWGKIISETISTVKTEESAFGEAAVRTYEKKVKDWIVTGTSKVAYNFGEENVLTMDDLTKAMQDREVMLAEKKKQSEEYRLQRASAPAQSAFSNINKGNFSNF